MLTQRNLPGPMHLTVLKVRGSFLWVEPRMKSNHFIALQSVVKRNRTMSNSVFYYRGSQIFFSCIIISKSNTQTMQKGVYVCVCVYKIRNFIFKKPLTFWHAFFPHFSYLFLKLKVLFCCIHYFITFFSLSTLKSFFSYL